MARPVPIRGEQLPLFAETDRKPAALGEVHPGLRADDQTSMEHDALRFIADAERALTAHLAAERPGKDDKAGREAHTAETARLRNDLRYAREAYRAVRTFGPGAL